jgi:hypothetical protein
MRTARAGESALLLLDAVGVLVANKIEYAVVGAIAASIHGAVRASMDADVVLSLAVQQAKELEQTFKTGKFSTELSCGDVGDPIPALLKLRDGFGNRVDFMRLGSVEWTSMHRRIRQQEAESADLRQPASSISFRSGQPAVDRRMMEVSLVDGCEQDIRVQQKHHHSGWRV